MLTLFTLILACGGTTALEGEVTDLWGQPIEGATVMMVGHEQVKTDEHGRYRLARTVGEQEIKVGHKDYIQKTEDITVSKETAQGGPSFKLYKKAEDKGFYLVGSEHYEALAPAKVLAKGNQLKAVYGIESMGDAEARASKFELVFRTDLKLDEIHRLGLELYRMEYVQKVDLPGPLGQATETEVNLYVAADEIPFKITRMGSKEHFLLTAEKELPPGTYAFQTQELLTPKSAESFSKIPDNLRVIFPLTITD